MIDRTAQEVEIDSDIFGKKYIAGDIKVIKNTPINLNYRR